MFEGGALRALPEEDEHGGQDNENTDEDGPPNEGREKDGRRGGARRLVHDVLFLRFEGEGKAEKDGGGHVDPKNLHCIQRRR